MTAACCTDIVAPPEAAEGTFAPLFRADWREVLFVHFRVDPAVLQPLVPLELDLYEGHAYVSLVAFTQARLRPAIGGALTEWLSRPLANHGFLNVRTYVRHGGERGIYFLAEWIPNRLATFLGPRLYGLPYRLGRLRYDTTADASDRSVVCASGEFHCRARLDPVTAARCEPHGQDAFLLERYIAFTHRDGILRRFRIRHEPWRQVRADVEIDRCDLLPAGVTANPCGANYSPRLVDVQIGRPERVAPAPRARSMAWLPLVILPVGVFVARPLLPAWAFMWALAYALYFGCKWLTYRTATVPTRSGRVAVYLLAWPGMDAEAFLDERRTAASPKPLDWLAGAAKAGLGALMLWALLPAMPHVPQLLAGSIGLVGLILLLHFGLFDLLARLWQRAGIDAQPIMKAPLRSRTLTEFWGGRWNMGFRKLSYEWIFRPLHARLGTAGAMFATFLASGAVHDLVISVPARGGYGLPTLYFLAQGLGVAIERSRLGRMLHLRRGISGRMFTAPVLLAPLPLLFPPPFLLRVIVPFLHAIGSYSR
jgi:uncharacterized protein YqjF (DUF2071 family)